MKVNVYVDNQLKCSLNKTIICDNSHNTNTFTLKNILNNRPIPETSEIKLEIY